MEKSVKNKALELGFDLVGITDASPIPAEHIEYLKQWLAAGYAGDMAYMHRNFEKRINPSLLLDGAKSVVCVALNYKPVDTMELPPLTFGRIATYACYDDYHEFIKKKLFLLADFIKSLAGKDFRFKVCVDSAPLAERSLAARAGLGFIARNHMLTNPVFGQQLLLGELITNIELRQDQPLTDNDCSGCCQCAEACPTGALARDGSFDARRCISYLTIEHKDTIPQELAPKIDSKLFGCDDCVLACRRQKDAPAASSDFEFHSQRQWLDLCQVLEMDEKTFKKRFADSPILRLGLERLKRNAVVCLLNSRQSSHGARKLSSADVGTSTPR